MSKLAAIALLLIAAGLTLAVAWHDRGMAVDDAYITFRYAENLATGVGLRWNADSPPSEGYSNLSYVLGVAVLRVFGVPPPLAALALATVGIALLTWLFARAVAAAGAFAPIALVPLVFVFSSPDLVIHASRGLETVLFAALAVAQVAAASRLVTATPPRRRDALVAAAVGALLFLTRPDGVLVSTMCWIGAGCLVRADRERRAGLLVAVLVWLAAGGLYASFKLWWFGHLLPNPFYMKADVQGFAGVREIAAFLRAYAPLGVAFVASAVLAARVPRPDVGGGRAATWIACAIALPWLGYGAKIMHEIGFAHRFAWPLVPVLAFAASRNLAAVGRTLLTTRWRGTWPLAWALLAAVVASQWSSWQEQCRHLQSAPQHDPCTAGFLRLGEAIRDTGYAAQLTLFCSNAGATPFVAGAHHVDPAGLVDDGYCNRTPPEVRARYQAEQKFDLVAWNLFPASPGATSFDDDARALGSAYLAGMYDAHPSLDASLRHAFERTSVQDRKASLFLHMFVLRDHATLVGEMDLGLPRSRLFVYVWKHSPRHDQLVAHLRDRVDIPAERIDFVGKPW